MLRAPMTQMNFIMKIGGFDFLGFFFIRMIEIIGKFPRDSIALYFLKNFFISKPLATISCNLCGMSNTHCVLLQSYDIFDPKVFQNNFGRLESVGVFPMCVV